jgi:hypothetical protein
MTDTMTHPLVLAIRVLRQEVADMGTQLHEATMDGRRQVNGRSVAAIRRERAEKSLVLQGMERAAALAVDSRYGFAPFTSEDYFTLMREDA